jgi:RNA polymerase sigma factor (sigma-70 family)
VTTTEIIQELRKGNTDALMDLYRDHASTIFAAAYSVLNNKVLAKDICHNCFLKLFEKAHQLKTPDQALSWMRTVARNEALMELRKNKRFDLLHEDLNELAQEEATEAKWQNWKASDVINAIKQLPEGYRLVLSLYLLESLSHEEIALALKIAPSTSRSQYARGRKKLIENLTLNYE